ncbi:transcription factor SPT20 homolog [Hippopotamus amphibius kiboko]|uniref:transcription factor SPT20 homolog n=1 Tax=Hippopotamus amphibius kiboko TaxID=575201 RepID=UPI002599CF2F|nr:transcription factor SPT20 homolog [Hippopotamus amphibius kiboko]
MQQALERALDRAEYVIASAQQRPPKRKYSSSGETSLYEKLYDIYAEECEKEPEVTEELRSNVNLLEKLVRRESLPCLVVSLYPGKKGYSLVLRGGNGSSTETVWLPYEERELLEYLDAEELPPVLVDVLEKSQVNVFHHGCVIAEIRDYRQCSDRERPGYQSRHILLRPTMQTLACDVEAIASDHQNWTQEDKLLLESQLILATAEPLCLDPSISVACTANRLLYNKQKLNTLPMKRSFKRFSTASLNQQEELSHCPPPAELRALTSCKKIRESKTGEDYGLKISEAGNWVDMWEQRPCDLAIPSEVDVEKYAKGKKSVRYGDPQPRVWPVHEVQDDSVFGCEEDNLSQITKLAFMQSLNDPLTSGKSRSHKKVRCERQPFPPHSSIDDHSNSFMLGPKTDAGRVVSWPEEFAQKSPQCPVQMSHSSGESAGLRQPSPGKEPEQPKIGSVQSSVLGKEAKHPPLPIRFVLNSGKSSRDDSFTSQQASSSQKSPFLAPAPKPPSLPQKSSVEVNQVSLLPAMALSTVGSSQRTEVLAKSSDLNITKVECPGGGGQPLGRCASPMQGSTTGAQLLQESRPVSCPQGSSLTGPLSAGAQPPNALPAAPPAPSQGGVQLLFKNVFNLTPLGLLQLPPGSLILNTQQQVQELQQQQQHWLCQLIPQQQLQQPTTSHPQQPVPQDPVQGSVSQVALSTQQAMLLNFSGVESFLQPQAAAVQNLAAPSGCDSSSSDNSATSP